MSESFQCSECCATVKLPISSKIKTVTCARCGDVSLLTDGERRRFYPALHMQPLIAALQPDTVYSAWMPPHTRPVIPGAYECRFRTTEPHTLALQWDGVKFTAAGRRVAMGDFLTWRGVLA